MKWNIEKKYLRIGLIALCVIILSILFNYTLQNTKEMTALKDTLKGTFGPIFMGCLLAYLLTPILHFFERYCFTPLGEMIYKKKEDGGAAKQKFSRGLSILCTIIFLLIIVVGGLYLVIPQVYQSLLKIVTDAPYYYEEAQKHINALNKDHSEIANYALMGLDQLYTQAINYLNQHILPNMDKIVASITSGIVGGIKLIFNTILAIVISIYVMAGKETLISVAKKLVYSIFRTEYANGVINGVRYAAQVFGGFVNGKIIDSFIIGGICYVFMVIAQLDYAVLISMIVGITNIIPYFGPFIGAIPSCFILLMVEPRQGIIFLVFVIILQQIDGNIIGPLVLGDQLKLSGMWILFSILIGGGLFGIIGMILGAPCFACIYALVGTICKKLLQQKNLPVDTDLYYNVQKVVPTENGNYFVVQEAQQSKEKSKGKKEITSKKKDKPEPKK